MKHRAKLLVVALGLVVLLLVPQSLLFAATTLKFFHTLWIPSMVELMDEAAARYEEENPGIKIEQTRVSWTDAPSQLMTSIMGGEPPDITMAGWSMVGQFRGMGAFADITDLIPEEMKKSFLPTAVEGVTYEEGRFDGVPQEGCIWAQFYRKDLFAEAGLDPSGAPDTWEELVEYGEALTKDTDGDGNIDQWAFGWPVQAENAGQFWLTFLYQAGSQVIVLEDGKWKSLLDQKEALEGTQFMVDLVQRYKVSPASIVDMNWEDVTNGFAAGKFAIMHNGAWVVGSVKQKAPDLEGKWSTDIIFAGPGGRVTQGGPNNFHILKASKNIEQAWDFLEFLYEEGRTADLTYVEELANLVGSIQWNYDYMDFVRSTYEPLLQPFLEHKYAKLPPFTPHWQTFVSLFGDAAVQDMIMGKRTVKATLEDLHAKLNQLHSQ